MQLLTPYCNSKINKEHWGGKLAKYFIIFFSLAVSVFCFNNCAKFQTLDVIQTPLTSESGLDDSSLSATPNPPSDSTGSQDNSNNPAPVPPPTPQNTGGQVQWGNQPAGFTTVMDCPFNDMSLCGIENSYKAGQVIPLSESGMLSPGSSYKSTLCAGCTVGGTQLNYVTPKLYREMYVGLIWRTNPEFQGRSVGNKMFFIRGPANNGVFLFNNGALVNGKGPMIFGHNNGGLDNSHACSLDLGLACLPNAGPGILTAGMWTKLEAYIKSSTTATSRDGTVRWWVNGVLAGNYTNLNINQNGTNEWVWAETWDGTVSTNHGEWSHFIDHLRISVPN